MAMCLFRKFITKERKNDEIDPSFIISVIPRTDHSIESEPNQIKTGIEYKAAHGMATSFYFSTLSTEVYQSPELQDTGKIDTLKFLETEVGSWNLIFGFEDKEKNFSIELLADEVKEILAQNHIQLARS